MKGMRRLLFAVLVVSLALPAAAPVLAETPQQELQRLTRQLNQDQDRLNELNNRVERAEAELDVLNRKLADDQKAETELDQRLAQVARMEYQQPVLTLDRVLVAGRLDQLLSGIAQARLVARKQQLLLTQAAQLRREDEKARNQAAAKVAEVKAARDQMAQVASRTQSLQDRARDEALRTRAQLLAEQARATQVRPYQVAASSPNGAWPNHFAYGYCTWYVATKRYVPWFGNAIQWWPNARAYGYPEGQAPAVGAIMVTRESYWGHVAYVEAVSGDGSWTVSEMNYVGWNVVSRRTLRPGQAPVVGFIYNK